MGVEKEKKESEDENQLGILLHFEFGSQGRGRSRSRRKVVQMAGINSSLMKLLLTVGLSLTFGHPLASKTQCSDNLQASTAQHVDPTCTLTSLFSHILSCDKSIYIYIHT